MSSLADYLSHCQLVNANPHTTERSYYSALEALLDALTSSEAIAHSELTLPGSDMPDLGIYESGVPVLYAEVKLPDVPVEGLLRLEQARRYARAVAGRVLVTNLNDFVLARVQDGALVEVLRVRLFVGDMFGASPPRSTAGAARQLEELLAIGCAERQTISRPSDVAELLASYARALAAVLPDDALGTIQEGFRNWLRADLDGEFLVSTTVQAIVYGMFATWLESDSPDRFRWQDARDGLDIDVMADIVYSALSPPVVSTPGVTLLLEGVAGVLRRVDRDSLAEQFDNHAIEYFYEPFLAAYDPDLRDKLGVWYTPAEIAAYQVARADHHLKADLGIADGLADGSVVVLDPAAGTGTYLAAVYDHLYKAYQDQGYSPSEAAESLREASKVRLVGFEILPAALLIGSLHLRRLLSRRGAPLAAGQRPALYLTNSLTGWFGRDDPVQTEFQWARVIAEVEAANRYKHDERVLVVLGNPPYEGYSSADTPDEKRLVQPWTAPLASEWGIIKHRLNDPYVRFWAAAARRITKFTKTGIVSFISNRKWLTGRSYPAMRADLLAGFDKITVDDCGGDSRGEGGGATDESIFKTAIAPGVQVGIAIVTAVRFPESGRNTERTHEEDPANTTVGRRTVAGSAAEKREQLSSFRDDTLDRGLTSWPTSREDRWKLGGSTSADEWAELDTYFIHKNSGVQPVRAPVVTDYDKDRLAQRMDDYFNPDIPWDDLVDRHPGFAVSQARYDGPAVRKALLKRNREANTRGHDPARLVRCLWRPLDYRWLYWEPDHKLLNETRRSLIPYWDTPGQVCIVATQTRRRSTPGGRQSGAARPLVTKAVPLYHSMDPDARALPLWAPPLELDQPDTTEAGPARQANITTAWIHAARAAGVPGNDSAVAETVFYAICGVAASDAWLDTQPIEHDNFPTVPIPADSNALQSAATTGREYASLVDPCVEVEGVTRGTLRENLRGIAESDSPTAGDPVLQYGARNRLGGKLVEGRLLWGPEQGWRDISTDIANFTLGGFNPIRKHLSYFIGERLTFTDRRRVTEMARRIAAIQELTHTADTHFHTAAVAPLEAVRDVMTAH